MVYPSLPGSFSNQKSYKHLYLSCCLSCLYLLFEGWIQRKVQELFVDFGVRNGDIRMVAKVCIIIIIIIIFASIIYLFLLYSN